MGWYSVSPMLKEGIPVRAESYEPTGYSGYDFKNLESAMESIDSRYAIAVVRYVRPEKARGFDMEYGYSTDTWLRYLKAGLADLDIRMESLDKRRFAVIL